MKHRDFTYESYENQFIFTEKYRNKKFSNIQMNLTVLFIQW
jgi:hypothetical protein